MINAKDLRISNLVSTISEEPEYLEIEAIKDYDEDFDEPCVKLQSLSHWIRISDIEPIELTEEILLKCGFEINDRPSKDIYIEFNPRMAILFNQGNIAEMDLIQDGKFISFKHGHIKYLHQLQNLFKCLTNEELIYTL